MTEVPENLNPLQLPLRYWRMVDFGHMSLEEAKAKWADEVAAGAKYDPLG